MIRELVGHFDLYLETPWPQLVTDLPIRCIRAAGTRLHMQNRNLARPDLKWHAAPKRAQERKVSYRGATDSILSAMMESVRVVSKTITFDLPDFSPMGKSSYIVVRPATIRRESPMPARNPMPDYLALAAEKLRDHFRIVSVASLALNVEWPLLPLPYADETFHAGELRAEQLMALIAGAAGVVAGVGWAVPVAVAYRVPLFLIYGGCGTYDGPRRIFDPRMPTDLVHHAIPDHFCECGNRNHGCDKRIGTIDRQIDDWAMGLAARRSVAMAS